ncbi:hypothetical protein C8Q79DRAFT_928669 [Trametes meyenii]|nr:hypothetical protein C8Q79DRAFT_928669 [Trametes meyenii]
MSQAATASTIQLQRIGEPQSFANVGRRRRNFEFRFPANPSSDNMFRFLDCREVVGCNKIALYAVLDGSCGDGGSPWTTLPTIEYAAVSHLWAAGGGVKSFDGLDVITIPCGGAKKMAISSDILKIYLFGHSKLCLVLPGGMLATPLALDECSAYFYKADEPFAEAFEEMATSLHKIMRKTHSLGGTATPGATEDRDLNREREIIAHVFLRACAAPEDLPRILYGAVLGPHYHVPMPQLPGQGLDPTPEGYMMLFFRTLDAVPRGVLPVRGTTAEGYESEGNAASQWRTGSKSGRTWCTVEERATALPARGIFSI